MTFVYNSEMHLGHRREVCSICFCCHADSVGIYVHMYFFLELDWEV